MKRVTLAFAALAALAFGQSAAARTADGLVVDRVVVLMRHGVRPPTKAPAMPASVTPETWPAWPVAPGWLTPHGAAAVAALGRFDRANLQGMGLIPAKGCPEPGAIAVIADSDQRTIETAKSWVGALAPGCRIAIESKPQGVDDPLFGPIGSGVTVDAAKADAALAEAVGPGGMAALEEGYRPLLARLDAILCGPVASGCGVSREPTGSKPARADARPKLTGALDRASTAAQILLLEYADGKPMAQVGWGRASADDIAALATFHALEFRLLARPRYLASLNLALLAPRIVDALTSNRPDAPRITLISGHDTTVASLGGLLGVHWHVPGVAADDPVPGGAIVLERLHDARGRHFVRARYRAQPLAEIRAASGLRGGTAQTFDLAIEGCQARGTIGLCTIEDLATRLRQH